jgi:uncharacterized membrane protein YcaP (DUF421 family)
MSKEDIKLGDLHRIFIGDAPLEFLVEVFFRTLITYIALMFLLRILGKRMNGKATVLEMAVILTLGAIVSVPMQSPDKGILIGVLALTCAFVFHRGLNWLNIKSAKIERLVMGRMHILIKDGVIQIPASEETNISTQQLLTVLRNEGVFNLGAVKRLYIEASGVFTIYKSSEEQWGLSTMPPDDQKILEMYSDNEDAQACTHCGYVSFDVAIQACKHCGAKSWTKAIKKS